MKRNSRSKENYEFIKDNHHKGLSWCFRRLEFSNFVTEKSSSIDIRRFFNITEGSIAYLLGILWADGSIGKYNTSFSCLLKDFNEVKPLFDDIGGFSLYIRPPRKRCPNSIGACQSSNWILRKFLEENDYHLKSKCSACKILSKIPDHLLKYWWRGYCDGDGHLRVDPAGRWSFVFGGSFEQDWTFSNKLMSNLNIKHSLKRGISKYGHRSSEIICANQDGFIKFCDFIYQDYDGIGFSRKYNTYVDGVKMVESHRENLNKRSQPISYYDKEWNHLGDCVSIQEAGRILGIKPKLIREYFQFKRKWCYNYQFKKIPNDYLISKKVDPKPISL